MGDVARAETLFSDSLDLFQELGDKSGIANATANLGRLVLGRGDMVRARQLFNESLAISQELGYKEGVANALEGFAHVVALEGRPIPAARLIGVVDRMYEQSGIRLAANERAKYDRTVAAIRGCIDAATYEAAWAEGQAQDVDRAVSSVLE